MGTDFEALAARVYHELAGRPAIALALAEKGLGLARQKGVDSTIARMLLCRAHALRESGRYREALKDYKDSERLYRLAGQPVEAWRTAIGRIDALDQIGEYQTALQIAKSAMHFFRKNGYDIWEAKIHANTGNLYQHLDRYDLALRHYRIASKILSEKSPLDANVARFNEANLRLLTGKPAKALELLADCREYFEREQLPHFLGSTYYNLAYAFYLMGRYQDSLSHIKNARELFRQLRDRGYLASCYLDESELYFRLNRVEETIQMARKAKAQFQKLGMRYEEAEANTILGTALLKKDKIAPGIAHLEKARLFFQNHKNEVKSAEIGSRIALGLLKQGQKESALLYLKQAYRVFSKHSLYPRMLSSLVYMAAFPMGDQQWKTATSILRQARPWLNKVDLPWVLFPYYQMLGKAEAALGHPTAARTLARAVRLMENQRSEISAETLRISFFRDKLEPFHQLVELGLRKKTRQGIEFAFRYAERARSRTLLDLLQGALSVEASSPVEEPISVSWHIQKGKSIQTPVAPQIAMHNGNLQERISIPDIRSALGTDQAIVSFYLHDNRLHAFVLDRQNLLAFPNIADLSELRQSWQLLSFQLERVRLDGQGSLQDTRKHQEHLGSRLLDPLYAHLKNFPRWTILPYGWLHHLPFHCFAGKEGLFADRHEISYAPSSGIYLHCLKQKSAGKRILLMGYADLAAPWIDNEILAIKTVFPDAVSYLHNAASSPQLESQGPHAQILHLAGHGRFKKNEPYDSGILLSDGWLTVSQIYQLRLQASLVTLSGCETGGHEISEGDELLGLTRGFLYAGAASLLVSLWRVSDRSTAFFMTQFYSQISSGSSKMKAWQKAVIRTREQWPHPYYWAPFVLIGAP